MLKTVEEVIKLWKEDVEKREKAKGNWNETEEKEWDEHFKGVEKNLESENSKFIHLCKVNGCSDRADSLMLLNLFNRQKQYEAECKDNVSDHIEFPDVDVIESDWVNFESIETTLVLNVIDHILDYLADEYIDTNVVKKLATESGFEALYKAIYDNFNEARDIDSIYVDKILDIAINVMK